MSEPVAQNLPEVSEALAANGHDLVDTGDAVEEYGDDDSGEESDDYEAEDTRDGEYGEEGEEEEEEEEEEEGDGYQKQGGLTAMLLGDPNGVQEEEESEEVEEDDDYHDVEEVPSLPSSNGTKRKIGDVEEETKRPEEESNVKKVKA